MAMTLEQFRTKYGCLTAGLIVRHGGQEVREELAADLEELIRIVLPSVPARDKVPHIGARVRVRRTGRDGLITFLAPDALSFRVTLDPPWAGVRWFSGEELEVLS